MRQPGTGSGGREGEARRGFSARGFTLLELLIAMALLVLIIAIALGALRLAFRSAAAGERKTEWGERLRTVRFVLDAQIQSQLPLTREAEGKKEYYFRGDEKTLQLTTGYSLWSGAQAYTLADYRVEADDAGRQTLWARERTPGIEGERETRLFTGAHEISFAYYRREEADAAGQWSGQWPGPGQGDQEAVWPEQIRLRVGYDEKEFIFLFPLRARGQQRLVPLAPYAAPGGTKR